MTTIGVSKRIWHYAKSDEEWSHKAVEKSGGNCTWPGCTSHFGLGAHLVIPRGFTATRLIMENAVELCSKHHSLLEGCKGLIKYEQLVCILIGKDVYDSLKQLAEQSLKVDLYKGNIRSSDIDLEV